MSATELLNLGIAFLTFTSALGGILFVAFRKLRQWLRADFELVVAPIADEQKQQGKHIAALIEWQPRVDARLQMHGESIAYLKGKEDARTELAQAATAAAQIVHEAKEQP